MIVGSAKDIHHGPSRRAGGAGTRPDGCRPERIFGEQVSSTAKRAKLAECLAFLREGDVLTVTKSDRLARSTAELLSIEADLSKRGIGLVPWAVKPADRFLSHSMRPGCPLAPLG